MRRLTILFLALGAACGPTVDPRTAQRPDAADQWLRRAKASYHSGDFDDAHEASKQALVIAPKDEEIRLMAARVALTKLDFADALKHTAAINTTEAHSLRGRAHWYAGEVEQAADELEAMLADPSVKDPWARDVARLARRGIGRKPFQLEGRVIAPVDMPRFIGQVPVGPANVVPCELEGERILALVATGTSEVIIDSNSRKEPAWVNLRFNDVEVKDVPALTKDLSPLSRQLGIPIKALLGVNFLRHAHATFDRRGDQFIVRKSDATAPPDASRIPIYYVRGGGMTIRANFATKDDVGSPLLVDTSRFVSVAVDDDIWKRAGVDITKLTPVGDAPNIRRGQLPMFRFGGYDLSKIAALQGLEMTEIQQAIDVDLGGLIGAELLELFRVTFADEGRFIWAEVDPTAVSQPPKPALPPPDNAPPPPPPPPSPKSGEPPKPPQSGGTNPVKPPATTPPPGPAATTPRDGPGAKTIPGGKQ
jgi:hypothetical protein